MEAIVLAGGLGTRLRCAVPDLPKPMAPVRGEPFLAHLLRYWIAQGVRRFVLSIGYRADAIRGFFGPVFEGVALTMVEEHTPLGTGGAALFAARALAEAGPVLLLNGDTYFAVSLPVLARHHQEHAADITLALRHAPPSNRYGGVVMDASGRIKAFPIACRNSHWSNGGVYLLSPELLATTIPRKASPVSFEYDLLNDWIGSGRRVSGYVADARFVDIGVPEDYFRAATLLAAGPPP